MARFLALIVFVVFVVFLVRSEEELKNQAPAPVPGATSEPVQNVSVALIKVEKVNSEPSLSQEARKEILKCFPNRKDIFVPSFSEENLLTDVVHATQLWKNIQFIDRNGSKKRLRLEKGNLQLFAVNSEDLPTPIAMDDNDRIHPSEMTIQKYLSGSRVLSIQELSQIRLKNGVLANVERENSKIYELEMFSSGMFLGCSNSSGVKNCKCVN
jgi:hypothetical protein